jgi:hypothetical protein
VEAVVVVVVVVVVQVVVVVVVLLVAVPVALQQSPPLSSAVYGSWPLIHVDKRVEDAVVVEDEEEVGDIL